MGQWRHQRGSWKIPWDNKNGSITPQNWRDAAKTAEREVYSNTSLPQETRNNSNSLTHHLKGLEKEGTKPKVSRRKEILKIRNEMEIKKTTKL